MYSLLRSYHFRRSNLMLMNVIEDKDFVDSLMDEVPAHLWNKLDPDDIIWDEDIPSPKYYVLSKW